MNFETYLNSLKTKEAKKLTVREFALLARFNSLSELLVNENGEVNKEEVLKTLENEYKQAKEINSVANITTQPGGAKELVPESVLVSTLIDLSEQGERYSFLTALKGKQTLIAQTQLVPIIGRSGKARILGQMASDDEVRRAKAGLQKANSSSIEIKSQKLYNSAIISVELQKYSVVELEALMLGKIKEGILLSMADAVINADSNVDSTANINYKGTKPNTISDYDQDSIYSYDNGLRKVALASTDTKLEIGTVEGANDIFRLQGMVTSTSTPGRKIIIMDEKTYYKELEQEDFKDAAKNGAKSTIFSGAITNIAGSDLFVTDLIKPAGADGLVSANAGDNTTGTILVLDITAIQHGDWNELKFNTEQDFAVGNIVETYGFWGFANLQGKDGLNFVSIGYNVS